MTCVQAIPSENLKNVRVSVFEHLLLMNYRSQNDIIEDYWPTLAAQSPPSTSVEVFGLRVRNEWRVCKLSPPKIRKTSDFGFLSTFSDGLSGIDGRYRRLLVNPRGLRELECPFKGSGAQKTNRMACVQLIGREISKNSEISIF